MTFRERLFDYLKIDEEAYRKLCREPSPFLLPHFEENEECQKAIAFLNDARNEGAKVLIYGDYDCDGAMATSIIYLALKKYGLDVSFYLPSRYLDGYGLNDQNLEKIASAGFRYIFLVDNGVSCFSPLRRAKELGIRAMAIDHHSLNAEIPPLEALIHPFTLNYPAPSVSAGYLSSLFASALLKNDDPYLIALGGLSTLSDMMELKEHNRIIVQLLEKYQKKYNFPSLSLLLDGSEANYKNFSLKVIPSINAVGRLEEGHQTNRLVRYFASDDLKEQKALATCFKNINNKRKELTKEATNSFSLRDDDVAYAYVFDGKEGLNGLIANAILQKKEKPVAVFARSNLHQGSLVGSMRVPSGFDCREIIDSLSFTPLSYGGHQHAAGLSIKEEDFLRFRKEFIAYALKKRFQPSTVDEKNKYCPLFFDEINEENAELVLRLEPYGQGFPSPIFLLEKIEVEELSFTRDGRFLLTSISNGLTLFSFTLGEKNFHEGEKVELYGEFRLNDYQNSRKKEFLVLGKR